MTGASVVPAFCRMDDQGTFHLDFREPFLVPASARRPADSVEWVRKALADGKWRASPQAKDWAGKPVAEALGLDCSNADHKRRYPWCCADDGKP